MSPLINNIERTGVATLLCQYTDSSSITYWSIMGTRKHRLVWESVNGPIPKDENNRSYEIHHIDGNHSNNDITNLKLVTIQEHYDLHYAQQDWNACRLIAIRMNLSPEEISELSRIAALEKIKNGTHHFVKLNQRDRADMRGDLNPMRNPAIAKKVADQHRGKIVTTETRKLNGEATKKHPKITCIHCNKSMNKVNYDKWHGDVCLKNANSLHNHSRVTNFSKNNPSKQKKICEHCNIECSLPNYNRWHGNNCGRKS